MLEILYATRFTECINMLESMSKNETHMDPVVQKILKDQSVKRALGEGPACPEYWKMSPAKTCVHVFTYNVANWTEARKFCHRFNGDLVTIGDDWMNFWLQHQLIETNVDEAWIGMSKGRISARMSLLNKIGWVGGRNGRG